MAIPRPEPGLVVNYAYLWHHEKRRGSEEGRKDRPAVVVLSIESKRGGTDVIVLPITHRPPAAPDDAVELPAAVKQHLGLDDMPSWIVVSEGNEFVRPGYDLRPRRGGNYVFGYLPPKLFAKVRNAFVARAGRAKTSLMSRD